MQSQTFASRAPLPCNPLQSPRARIDVRMLVAVARRAACRTCPVRGRLRRRNGSRLRAQLSWTGALSIRGHGVRSVFRTPARERVFHDMDAFIGFLGQGQVWAHFVK